MMKRITQFTLLYLFSQVTIAAVTNPCLGAYPLENITNRPTKSDSACVVPYKEAVLETGYSYVNTYPFKAYGQNYPQPVLRFGLPDRNEVLFILPNYNSFSINPKTGFNATSIGVKHELPYTEHLVASIEGYLSLPSGGGAYGTNKYNPTLNAIATYLFNPIFSFSVMLGIGTQSLPALSGGGRYTSFNPDFVFAWQFTPQGLFYIEAFGQTKTAPNQGPGWFSDGGILYSLTPTFAVDIEIGQRISGSLASVKNYYGFGLTFLIR